MSIGIYKITNTIDGKAYIGQSRNIERRLNKHKTQTHNRYLARAFVKYGVGSFEFSILREYHGVVSQEELNKKEIELIKEYKTIDSKYGYNLSEGGYERILPEESRLLISRAVVKCWQNKDYRERIIKSMKERIVSDDVRVRISNTTRKRWEDPEYKARVSKKMIGHLVSSATRDKISIANAGRKPTSSTIKASHEPIIERKRSSTLASNWKQRKANGYVKHEAINQSGYTGVYWKKGRWRAYYKMNQMNIYVGTFDDPVIAYAARGKALISHINKEAIRYADETEQTLLISQVLCAC
jgi:group I intron endonuclease